LAGNSTKIGGNSMKALGGTVAKVKPGQTLPVIWYSFAGDSTLACAYRKNYSWFGEHF
jgi:hypothetical protein